jgi:hypothetical protein
MQSHLGSVIFCLISTSWLSAKFFEHLCCNTPSVTMAMAHLCTNDCDHMWKKHKEKIIRTLETMY